MEAEGSNGETTDDGAERRTAIPRLAIIIVALALAVIVPFVLFGGSLEVLALSWLDAIVGRPLVLSAMVIVLLGADVLLPVPSSLVAVLSGSVLGLAGGVLVNWLGLCLGSLFGYWLGRRGGHLALGKSGAAMTLARSMAERYGAAAIAICRPVPVLAEVSAIYLGISAMPFRRYLLVSGASNLAVAAAYAATGAWAASFDSFIILFAASISLPTLLWLIWRFLAGRAQRNYAAKVP